MFFVDSRVHRVVGGVVCREPGSWQSSPQRIWFPALPSLHPWRGMFFGKHPWRAQRPLIRVQLHVASPWESGAEGPAKRRLREHLGSDDGCPVWCPGVLVAQSFSCPPWGGGAVRSYNRGPCTHHLPPALQDAFLAFHRNLDFVRKFMKPLLIGELAPDEPSQDRGKNVSLTG